ncbi:MAG: hypothetical protein NUV57_06035 [archaeon]|nr:hypothetical protein [archaeon]
MILLDGFESTVKKSMNGALYFNIPKKIMNGMKLKPFIAGTIKSDKKGIRVSGFEKTVKIKLDLTKKDIAHAKQIMKEEGYGSIDETFCNIIHRFIEKKKIRHSKKTHVVYVYPEGFLNSKFILINEYKKIQRKNKKTRNDKKT